jgi:DNA-binding transcriptional LysR family regulator
VRARLPRAVMLYPDGRRVLADDVLSAFGAPEAEVRSRMPYFLAAPLVVAGADQVMCLPARVGLLLAGLARVAVIDLPELEGFTYRVVWHKRADGDPALACVRELLARVTVQAGPV